MASTSEDEQTLESMAEDEIADNDHDDESNKFKTKHFWTEETEQGLWNTSEYVRERSFYPYQLAEERSEASTEELDSSSDEKSDEESDEDSETETTKPLHTSKTAKQANKQGSSDTIFQRKVVRNGKEIRLKKMECCGISFARPTRMNNHFKDVHPDQKIPFPVKGGLRNRNVDIVARAQRIKEKHRKYDGKRHSKRQELSKE